MSAPPIRRLVSERRVSVVRDGAAVRRVFDDDPIGSCMVAARVADHGIESNAIGGELWTRRGADESLCYAGANLIPLRGRLSDLYAFADAAMTASRRCSSLVGRAEFVMPMWQRLEPAWGPARDVRSQQPLMSLTSMPNCAIDPDVRQVRPDEIDTYLVAAIDMFIGEVGVDPRLGDGGRGYRRRVASLIAAGRAWARFENGEVVFKAEVGSQSPDGQPDPRRLGASRVAWPRSGDGRYRDAGRGDRGHRAHRQPVRERLQHGGPRHLRPHRLHRSRHLRDRPAGLGASRRRATRKPSRRHAGRRRNGLSLGAETRHPSHVTIQSRCASADLAFRFHNISHNGNKSHSGISRHFRRGRVGRDDRRIGVHSATRGPGAGSRAVLRCVVHRRHRRGRRAQR